MRSTDVETLPQDFIEAAMVKALFPQDALRRRFLQAVGANTARAAIASLLPISAMQAMAQDKGTLEKRFENRFHCHYLRNAGDHGRPAGLLQERIRRFRAFS